MNEIEEYGYADIPPEGTTEIPNPPEENRSVSDRPVYTIPEDAKLEKHEPLGKLNYAVLAFTGLIMLALAGAYLYRSGEKATMATVPAHVVETTANGPASREAVKIELLRTIDLLTRLEEKLVDSPDKLAQVRNIKIEAAGIVKSLSGEEPAK